MNLNRYGKILQFKTNNNPQINVMIWNNNKIEKLKREATNAQLKIVQMVFDSAIKINDDYYAWGQFLNREKIDDQYGIYGTSAAIKILTLAGYKSDNEFVSKACTLINDYSNDPNSRFNRKDDFSVTYKLAYLLNACKTCTDLPICKLYSTLIMNSLNSILEGKGWGYFHDTKSGTKDSRPRITATAMIMLSLEDHKEFINSDICKSIINWLFDSIQSSTDLKIYDISLCTLVFIDYSRLIVYENSEKIINDCCARLKEISKTRNVDAFYYTENHHFHFMLDNERTNKYLFFLPDCLIAETFLRNSPDFGDKKFILKVAKFYTKEINENNGFSPRDTGYLSTIDHLWIYTFFCNLKKTDSKSLIPNGISRIVSKPTYFYLGLAILFIAISSYIYSSENMRLIEKVVYVFFTCILAIGWNLLASWIDRTLLNKS